MGVYAPQNWTAALTLAVMSCEIKAHNPSLRGAVERRSNPESDIGIN